MERLISTVMIVIPYIFIGLVVAVLIYIMFKILFKRSKNIDLQNTFGGKVLEDLGIIAVNPISYGSQKLRLLRCIKDGVEFMVIEVNQEMLTATEIYWIKIDEKAYNQIVGFAQGKRPQNKRKMRR